MEPSTKEVEGARVWRPQMHAHGRDIHSKDSVIDKVNITIGLAKVSIIPPKSCILEDLDDDALARSVVQLMVVKEEFVHKLETVEKSKKVARDVDTLGKGLNSSLKFDLEALRSSLKIAMDEAYDEGFEKA
ncbi:unnamed protein product [Ilex paraguariensis]|uniref:Uncharacterized protein n=1 Tax=Ilex paraguariensis TaxID=185542 RepID=A0ABC8SLN4_9AQUA